MAVTLGTAYISIKADTSKLLAEMGGVQTVMKQQLAMQSLMFQKMGMSANRATVASKKVAKGFGAAIKNALSLQRVLNRIAFIATVGIAYGLGRAITNAFKSSIQYAVEFEKQMANVYTMLDKTDKVSKDFLARGIEKATADFGEASTTLSKGLYDILSASTPVIQSLYVLETAARAGAAGMSDTKTAADAITSVLNAYQLSAGQAADVSDWLFSVVKEGKLTFADLAQNIGKVISSAAIGGLSLEELGASIATMTRQGIKPREAMTALNRLILSFIKPTKQASEVARKYGMDLSAATLKTLGLTGVIKKLTGATKEELAILGTTVRAFKGFAAGAVDSTGQLEDLDEITNRAGSTQDAYNEVAATTAFKMGQARESIRLFNKEIAEKGIPIIGWFAKGLRDMFRAASGIDTSDIQALNDHIERISKTTDEALVTEKRYSQEHIKNHKERLKISETSLNADKIALGVLKNKGQAMTVAEHQERIALALAVDSGKESVEASKKWLQYHKDRLIAINAEITARKKLAKVDNPEDKKKAMEELISVQKDLLAQAVANGKGEAEAMKNLIATYTLFKDVLLDVGASESVIERINTAIAILNKKLRELGIVTEDTTKIIVEATITWQEAMRDYTLKTEDVMESAISSIGGMWSDLWSDIASGQNMMKKNWADYLKSLVDSFIAAVGRMIAEWLAFKAIMLGIDIATGGMGSAVGTTIPGAAPGVLPTILSPGGNGTFSPNINVESHFSRRDSGWIVKQGQDYNHNTRL